MTTEVPVSEKGDVLLPLDRKLIILWGWRLYCSFRGQKVLILTRDNHGKKELVITTSDGAIWLPRVFDPSAFAFWTHGRRQLSSYRLYTFRLPQDRTLRAFGIELLFNGKWRPHMPVFIWHDGTRIARVSGLWNYAQKSLLRAVRHNGRLVQLIVGSELPHALLTRVTGELEGVVIQRVPKRHYYFEFGQRRYFVTDAEGRRLGIKRGGCVSIVAEQGIALEVRGDNGYSLPLLAIRDARGRIIRAASRRISKALLPSVAVVSNVPARKSQNDTVIHLAGRKFILPIGYKIGPGTILSVVIGRGESILYLSQSKFTPKIEWELVVRLTRIFPLDDLPDYQLCAYCEIAHLVKWSWQQWQTGSLERAGLLFLYRALAEHLSRIQPCRHPDRPSPQGRLIRTYISRLEKMTAPRPLS